MKRRTSVVLYLAVMVALIVVVDLLFLRGRFWPRLIVNVGLVAAFAILYFRFLNDR